MKTRLGVSVAVLAEMAAHGKDFDREAARVFRGSPLAPDPVCEKVKPLA